MKAENSWVPTKYVEKDGKLKASRNPSEVGVGSRLIGDLVARFYSHASKEHATGRLVDLGCGKVPLYACYRNYVSKISCIDWSHADDGPSHLDHVCDLAKQLPLPDKAYDTVILSDVLEHVANPELLWTEIARISAPGAKLLLNTPFLHCLHEQPHDYYRFTSHALRRYAENHGFTVVSLEAIGGTPEVIADILAKHLQYLPIVGKTFARVVQGVTRWFVGIKPGAKLSARTAEAFPLGYAMIAVRGNDEAI